MKDFNFSKHHCSASSMLGTYWKDRASLVFLFLFLPFLFFAQTVWAPGCGTTHNPDPAVNNQNASCSSSLNDFNTYHNDDMVPQGITRTLKIKTNVVLLQRENVEPDGLGNFSPSTNTEHKEFLDDVFIKMNKILSELQEENCSCTTAPLHYDNIHIEFVPNYIELESEYYWNHLNDPSPWSWNSGSKVFLDSIHNLLIQEGHEPAFDVFVTENKLAHDHLVIQDLGYRPDLFPDGYDNQWYSGLPKSNLSAPAFWHCPNLYSAWYDNRFNRQDDWPNWTNKYEKIAARGFLHEYGHYIGGLGHKSCTNNVMHPEGDIDNHRRNSFTGCQVRDIYRTIMGPTNMRKFVTCEDVLDHTHELVIDSDEEWNNNLRLYTNVRVKSGATLTVSCSLYLQPQAKITVERGARLIIAEDALIANGGVCSDETAFLWDGVHLHGNADIPHKVQYAFDWYTMTADDHGIVLMHPNSTIQDAQTAIDCLPEEEGFTFSDINDRKGGYVRAKGANFIQNTNGVNFTYSIYDNKSEVLDCIFEGGDYGITNRKANGVKVKTCEFNDQEVNGIYATDAGMTVQQNDFNRIDEAIAINNLLLMNDPFTVSRNEFFGNGVGVKASLASNLLIANNDFTVGKFGVSLMGQGQAVIQNNKFYDMSAGVDLQSAGEDYIPVGCNTFEKCSVGMNPSGNNMGLQYDRNQNLEEVIFDAFIESDGDGNPALLRDQGDEFEPRINAFSVGHTNHLYTKDNANESFIYFAGGQNINATTVPQCSQGDPDCLEPFNFELDLNTSVNTDIFENCGDIGTVITPEPPNPPCKDCGTVISFGDLDLGGLATAINTKIVSGSIGFTVKDKDLQKQFNVLLQHYTFNDDYTGLKNYLENFGDYFLPIQQSIAIHEKEYTLAGAQLDKIATYAGYESFVLAQKTYLQWVQDNSYRPNSEELNQLHIYANQDNPMAAFTRSILSLLYKEQFSPTLPPIPGLERNAKIEKEAAVENWVYPNPVEENLFIHAGSKIQGQGVVKIIDAFGRVVLEKIISKEEQLTIYTENWNKGIYWIELTDSQQKRHVEKVIKY